MPNRIQAKPKRYAYHIREAVPEDCVQLLPLMEQLGYPIEEEKMAENLKNYCLLPKQKAWVVEKDKRIVGCLAAAITDYFHKSNAFLRVIALVIDKDHRRSGMGKKLMNIAEKYAIDMGCSHVELTSGIHRSAYGTHHFYKSLGYVELNEIKKYFAKRIYPNLRQSISELIESLHPFDQIEKEHLQAALQWIDSGVEIFRRSKPDIPKMHLVSYFVPLDLKRKKILLTDHKKANLWLPPGGHVEVDEHPQDTVKREAVEELGIEANFISPNPFFLTICNTQGDPGAHTDVSLWYLISADSEIPLNFDDEEFNQIHWFSLDRLPYPKTDPYFERFIDKLKTSFLNAH